MPALPGGLCSRLVLGSMLAAPPFCPLHAVSVLHGSVACLVHLLTRKSHCHLCPCVWLPQHSPQQHVRRREGTWH